MADLKPSIPHFAMPFRIDNVGYGVSAVENEQDTLNDIAACAELSLRTPLGLLDSNPELGVTEQTFQIRDIDMDLMKWEIVKDEPRVELASEFGFDHDELIQKVLLTVSGSQVTGGNDV